MVNYSRNFIFQVKASLREFINLKASKSYQTMLDAVTSDTERGYSQGSLQIRRICRDHVPVCLQYNLQRRWLVLWHEYHVWLLCGSLDDKCSHSLGHLNTLFPVGRTVWVYLEGVALMEETCSLCLLVLTATSKSIPSPAWDTYITGFNVCRTEELRAWC